MQHGRERATASMRQGASSVHHAARICSRRHAPRSSRAVPRIGSTQRNCLHIHTYPCICVGSACRLAHMPAFPCIIPTSRRIYISQLAKLPFLVICISAGCHSAAPLLQSFSSIFEAAIYLMPTKSAPTTKDAHTTQSTPYFQARIVGVALRIVGVQGMHDWN